MQTLSINFDPESTTVGKPTCSCRGLCVLGRVNGEGLEVKNIEAAVSFIKEALVEWCKVQASNKAPGVEEMKSIAGKLRPEAFTEFKSKFSSDAVSKGHVYMYEAEEREKGCRKQ